MIKKSIATILPNTNDAITSTKRFNNNKFAIRTVNIDLIARTTKNEGYVNDKMFAILDIKRVGNFSYLLRFARLETEEQIEIFAEYQKLIDATECDADGVVHKKNSKAAKLFAEKSELLQSMLDDGYYTIINANNQAAYQLKGKYEDMFSVFAKPSKGRYEYEARTILNFFNSTVLGFADKVVASQSQLFINDYKTIRSEYKGFFQSALSHFAAIEVAKEEKDYSDIDSKQFNIDTLNFLSEVMNIMSKYVFNADSYNGAVRLF